MRHEEALREAFGLAELTCGDDERAWRVVLTPAFDPAVAITAWAGRSAGAVEARVLSQAVRRPAAERVRLLSRMMTSPGPEPSSESAGASCDRPGLSDVDPSPRVMTCALSGIEASALSSRMGAIDRAGLTAPPSQGLDGMGVIAEIADGAGHAAFRWWYPSRATAPGTFVWELLALATPRATDPAIARPLLAAARYLRR